MDIGDKLQNEPNPRENANLFSKICFWYTVPLFLKSFKKELKEDDMYKILPEFSSFRLGNKIEKKWKNLKMRKRHSMLMVFLSLHGKHYLLLGLTKIISITIDVFRPVVVGKLVSFFVPGQTEMTKADAYLYSGFLLGLNIIDGFYKQNYYMKAESLGIKFRTAVCSLIYRKSLQLSMKDIHNVPIGQVANLMTRDVSVFDFFFLMFNDTWVGLITTVVVCWQMYRKIGSAVYVLLVAFALFIPCLIFLGKKIINLKILSSTKTDKRIDILQEALSKIKSTKMYVWENLINKKVSEARREEMTTLFNMCITMFLLLMISILIYHVTHYLVLMSCIWTGQTLTAETMYFVATAFQRIFYTLNVGIPYAIFSLSQVLAALERLQMIIKKIDTEPKNAIKINKLGYTRVIANNATISINGKTILENINFDISKELTLITGSTSTGKSVLLLSILEQFDITKGSLSSKGVISYVSQEPWLFPSTIKQNILFGAKYDEHRYKNIIKMCALDYDFEFLEKGDDTIVSEQGINLSKGQQSRICLARAIYRNSDIYLLDDCLSHLDPLVASMIFHTCIREFLVDKLVILVTNNLSLLPYAKTVINLNNGGGEVSINKELIIVESLPYVDNLKSKFLDSREYEESYNSTSERTLLLKRNPQKVYDETKKSGPVLLSVYKKYINYGGGKFFGLVIFGFFVLCQICTSYKEKILSDWVNLEEVIRKSNTSTNHNLEKERNPIFYIYTVVIVLIVSTVVLRAYSLFHFSKKVSVNLHKKMLGSVMSATMSFFDSIFIGNIINRFSKDLIAIDENMPFILLHLTAIIFETLGNLILISLVNSKFLLATAALFSILFILRKNYLKAGRALKRLEATTKVPVVGYLNAVLRGLPTIQTFRAEEILKKEFDKHQDLYTSTCFSNLSCMKAFILVGDNITTLFLAVIVLKFVIFNKEANAGDVGLAISQALMMSGVIHWGFFKWAELEAQMTSVERALEYTTIKQESNTGIFLENWPQFGEIRFENVSLSFDKSKSFVLKNLNFVVRPTERISIVGRTGAGKSSILAAIFRLYEYQGDIIIDGNNIKTLSLDFLRKNISVIPEDPLLINETLRYNIDPGKKHSDEDIWKVLKTVKLKNHFFSLNAVISEKEITSGQMRLICLARVLLKQRKIVLLDEITENGDESTENLVFDIVDKCFSSSTVIKVTHNMKFAINSNRVLVLHNGEIVECDTPQSLLSHKNSLFYQMVQESKISFGS